jgi:peptide/nickel transport system permease protein
MTNFLIRRFFSMIVVWVGVATLTFFIANVIPSDPVRLRLGPKSNEAAVEKARKEFGLDKPLPVQFFNYFGSLLKGDLGQSIRTNQPVLSDLEKFFPATLELTLTSAILIILIAIPLGVLAAIHFGSFFDRICDLAASSFMGLPIFWTALIMQLFFYGFLNILPLDSRIDLLLGAPQHITGLFILDSLLTRDWPRLISSIQHIILPTVALSIASFAEIFRQVRANVLETLKTDFVRTARAKGLPGRLVTLRHVLRNSLLPVVTMFGLLLSDLLSGAFIIEYIFNWPGIGMYGMQSVIGVDYSAVVSVTLMVALICTITNLLVDLTYKLLDPRIQLT